MILAVTFGWSCGSSSSGDGSAGGVGGAGGAAGSSAGGAGGRDAARDDVAVGDSAVPDAVRDDTAPGPDVADAAKTDDTRSDAPAVGPYPPGPYGTEEDEVLANLSWEGYVNDLADEISTNKTYGKTSMEEIRRSGKRYALVHVSDYF